MLLQRQALRFSLSNSSVRSLSLTTASSQEKKPLALTAQQELNKWNANNKIFNRPLSPHLSIYEWSLPMAMSGYYRISSFILGMGFITAPLAYTGLNVIYGYQNPAEQLAAVAYGARNSGYIMLGVWLALKSQFVLPFVFHCVNGCRHLGWDQYAYGIRHLTDVYQSAYVVLAVTGVLTLALTVFYKDKTQKE